MNNITKKQPKEYYRSTHSPRQIAERLEEGPDGIYLKDFIYGAIDGAITTFAVVAGVAGAGLSSAIIIILGLANLLADGFSMAVSNYLGTRAENQLRNKTRQREFDEIRKHPDGEVEEIRQIYSRKGFEGELLEEVVRVITSDNDRWVEVMLQEEHGMPLHDHNAAKGGFSTFIAFNLVGLIPLLPYLYNWIFDNPITQPFAWSCGLTGVAFLLVGALKARFINEGWKLSAIETFLMGGAAAAMAYGVGALLKGLAQ